MAKLEFEIFDDQWPKLRAVGMVHFNNGQKTPFEEKVLYDQAYSKFENTLHNMLRPLVENVIKRRKEPMKTLGFSPTEPTEPSTNLT